MDEKVVQKNEDNTNKKKSYSPPTLVVYGKLTDLTASGTAGGSETSTGSNPMVGPLYMA